MYSEFDGESKGFQALYIHNKYWKRIEFVHTLQNLWFAMTDEELELKPDI